MQIHTINELRDILGVSKVRDPKEEELEEFIFGCDTDELFHESTESQSEEVNVLFYISFLYVYKRKKDYVRFFFLNCKLLES